MTTITQRERMRRYHYKKLLRQGKELIPCLICGMGFRQVGSHIVQVHNMTAREYRERFDLERKKGMLPKDLRKLKAKRCLENGTWENLKVGKKYWFKKGDKSVGTYTRSHVTIERLRELYKKRRNKMDYPKIIIQLIKNLKKIKQK